jgi:hypothetical protein
MATFIQRTFEIPITARVAQELSGANHQLKVHSDFYADVSRRVADKIASRINQGLFDADFIFFNDGVNLSTNMVNALIRELVTKGFTVRVNQFTLHISWDYQPPPYTFR